MQRSWLMPILLLVCLASAAPSHAGELYKVKDRDAWCIVPTGWVTEYDEWTGTIFRPTDTRKYGDGTRAILLVNDYLQGGFDPEDQVALAFGAFTVSHFVYERGDVHPTVEDNHKNWALEATIAHPADGEETQFAVILIHIDPQRPALFALFGQDQREIGWAAILAGTVAAAMVHPPADLELVDLSTWVLPDPEAP